jgi:hypothetical protein
MEYCIVACCDDISSMSVSDSLEQNEGCEASPGASISGAGGSMASESAALLTAAGGTRDRP